ncbi:MAG: GDP-mannose 4,6-dehydratase, partial [Cyanobacteria bacterium]|nr:GDP-mannose 4,6-dehydratase [Cyanobacteriota bacterium]
MIEGLRVLVTGCSGFLGPWLCEKLLDRGAVVYGIDIQRELQSRINELTDRMEFSLLDVENYEELNRYIQDRGIQYVFHLAAQALVGVALNDPRATLNTNIVGTINVLEIARKLAESGHAMKGILVASSDKAYGDQVELPYLENAPMLGKFPYDVSKSCCDLISRSYFHSYGLPVCVTRCGNLYGGGDLNWSRIIPGTIRSYIENCRPLIRSDGTPVRDYVYVEDAAEAMGSEYNNRKAGSFGDISAFSFNATKIMIAGHGGMVATNNK